MFKFRPFFNVISQAAPTEKAVSFGNNGIALNGMLFLPSGASPHRRMPGVVLCHGYGSNQADFQTSARELAAEGIAVLTFDFRGHGDSEGILDGSIVDDVLDAWEFLSRQAEVDPKNMGLIGHSMGAFSAILAAGKLKKARMLVSLACPGEIKSTVARDPRHFAYPMMLLAAKLMFKIGNFVCKLQVRADWKKFLAFWPNGKTSEALAELEDCAKLFVFCLSDIASPYRRFLPAYAMASEPKQIMVTPGGHTAPVESRSIRRQWQKWAVRTLHTAHKA